MELRHLRSFLAVAEALSFVRASEALHLSQPALTTQIQNLEEDLGVQLFTRNKRSVRLTAAGEAFVEEARETLQRVAKAAERVQRIARGEIGRLRIGFVSSAALEIVPSLVMTFQKQFPAVELELTNVRTTAQMQALLDGTLDIGFLRLPAEHKSLEFTGVHVEPFVAVLPRAHPLAQPGKRFALGLLRGERFVAYGRRWAPGFFDQVVGMCREAGFIPDIVQETADMYTALALVAAGQGVAILPRSVVLARTREVVIRPIPPRLGRSEIAISCNPQRVSPLARRFVGGAIRRSRVV